MANDVAKEADEYSALFYEEIAANGGNILPSPFNQYTSIVEGIASVDRCADQL